MHHISGSALALSAFGLLAVVPAVILYGAGVAVLTNRGDRWRVRRSACFFSGIGTVAAVTLGPFSAQAMSTFSAHMVQHMVLNMIAPILLVLGAPLTLALRTLPLRGRAVLVRATRSLVVRILTHPTVVAAIFTASLFLLYFTPLFPMLMADAWGHFLMQAHFLLSGYLFFWLLLGVDPGPGRPSHIARIPIIVVMVLGHTVFAFALVFSRAPIGGEFFAHMSGASASALMQDQALAGGIAWGLGEFSSAVVMAILLVQWFARSDRAEAAAARHRARLRARKSR